MACNECGAKRGHMKGCSKNQGTAAKRTEKAKGKGIMKGQKPRICFGCKGTGMAGKKTCPFCNGTGERG